MSIVRAISNDKYETITGDIEIKDSLPIGLVLPWAGSPTKIPSHLILLTGSVETPQLVSKLQYPVLFDVLGYTYGGSDDLFALPPYKGRVSVGFDSGQSEFNEIGKTGGEKTHKLTVDEMAKHSHSAGILWDNQVSGGGRHYFTPTGTTNGTNFSLSLYVGNQGGDQPHNNLPPYITQHFVIVAKTGISTQDVYDLDEELNKLKYNLITDGPSVKTGIKIDGKDEWVKRIDIGPLPNSATKFVNTGLVANQVTILEIVGSAKNSSGTTLPIPYYHLTSGNGIAVNFESDGTIAIQTLTNRSVFSGFVDIYFHYI